MLAGAEDDTNLLPDEGTQQQPDLPQVHGIVGIGVNNGIDAVGFCFASFFNAWTPIWEASRRSVNSMSRS
jgi:hypothetical protein